MKNKHNNCANFEYFDVAKGYCVRHGGLVPFDGEACECFVQRAKCKNCVHFTEPNAEGIGTCRGLEDHSFWALAERDAVNCEGYEKA